MGLFNLLTTSVSGMAAQSALLNAVSDNIANSSTVGYKESTTEFSSLVLNSGQTSTYQSGSVNVDPVTFVDAQGDLTPTSSSTDLAIKNNGFFIVQEPGGQNVLTRAGSFTQTSTGTLVNSAGYTLMAYPAGASVPVVANGYAGLVPVNVSSASLQATPTTTGTLSVNLPSGATTGTTETTSLTVYDQVGTEMTLSLSMANTGTGQWTVSGTLYDPSTATTGTAVTVGTLNFGSNGALTGTNAGKFTLSLPTTPAQSMSLDMSACTQLATDYTVLPNGTGANGNAPSPVSGVSVGTDGTVSVTYQNGATKPLYTIPLATVQSPNEMTAVSGNAWIPNQNSGAVQIGAASTGGFGTINSKELESSTVDLASQLTTMIAAQNNYEANSKVFNTGSQLLQVLINLGK